MYAFAQANERYTKSTEASPHSEVIYRLFQTRNNWIYLKLNTTNGIIPHVNLYDNIEFPLNKYSLVPKKDERPGRFFQQMMEGCNFMDIGSWWQAKKGKEACEIDIVGLYVEGRKALVAEVKRQRKNFKPDNFAIKVETLRNKVLHKYDIQTECLTLEDM